MTSRKFSNYSCHSRSTALLIGLTVLLASCKDATAPKDTQTSKVPQSLAFANKSASLVADDSLTASVTLTMTDGSVGDPSLISYSSSSPSIATINSKGLIRAATAGIDTITAQAGPLQDKLVLTVSWAQITGLTFSVKRDTVLLDDTLATHVAVTNSHNKPAPNVEVAYASTNPSIATVDLNGRIRGLALGTTTITGSQGSVVDTIEIAVVPQFNELAVGGSHTCGISGKHQLYCWGSDINGQLGGSSQAPVCIAQTLTRCSTAPQLVVDGNRFVSVTLGDSHTCGLTVAGVAFCWGANFNGALGIGSSTDKLIR